MTDKTGFSIEGHDILAAFSLLGRLPVPVDHARAGARGAGAAWAYPLVGLVFGALAGGIGAMLAWFGLPSGMVAVGALATLAILSGAMHEDGLADFADAMGARSRARRLEIMKDSRIGAFGTIALILSLLARWSAIAPLSGWELVAGLAVVGALSRAVMVAGMVALPPARTTGLSASTGRPDARTVLLALTLGLVVAVALTGLTGTALFSLALLSALPVLALAERTLGGQTGDVLGSVQQISEITALSALLALT